MNIFVIIPLSFIAGVCVYGIYAEIKTLRQRVKVLEESNVKRLPYKSRDAIEDATAAVVYVEQEVEVLQARLDHMRRLLNVARNPEKN